MPIYVYECKKCGRQFEVKQLITDEKFKNHSEITEGHYDLKEPCNGEVFRIIQNVNLKFNGKGWTPKFFRR